MSKLTKHIALASIIALVVSLGLLFFLVWQIERSGQTLTTYMESLQARNEKEATYSRVSRLVQDSAPNRALLAQAFFSDEGASIPLLNELELFADRSGITLETTGLDKITHQETNEEFITMTFSYSGSYEQVRLYTEMLEHLPYHSNLTDLSIRQGLGSFWEGNATVVISIKPSS